MARLDTPCNKVSQTGRENTAMRTREQGRKRGCENVAELDSSGRRGAFDKGEQETVQKIQDGRTRVCFPVQKQCGRGAQAVDGHSPNSIILLVAKIKTGRLDCE